MEYGNGNGSEESVNIDGKKLLNKYCEVAPKIIEKIDLSEEKEKYYQYIYEVGSRCVKLLSINETERALYEIKFMVENLKKEFSL